MINHEHHHAPDERATLNRLAVSATVHCLTGCSIGEVLGLVIGTLFGWGNMASVALAVVLAFVFGYALALRPLLAFASDTLSITVMEIVDNAVILIIPGVMEAGPATGLFWISLLLSLLAAFIAALPVNRWLIRRGRGHGSSTRIITERRRRE